MRESYMLHATVGVPQDAGDAVMKRLTVQSFYEDYFVAEK